MEVSIWILYIIIAIVSVLGILLVLMQSSRGGGSLFGDGGGGGQNVIGDRRGDFFSKLTAIFATIFIAGSFALAYLKHANMAVGSKPIINLEEQKDPQDEFTTDSKEKDEKEIKKDLDSSAKKKNPDAKKEPGSKEEKIKKDVKPDPKKDKVKSEADKKPKTNDVKQAQPKKAKEPSVSDRLVSPKPKPKSSDGE